MKRYKRCINNNFVKYEYLLELPSHPSISTKSTSSPVYVTPGIYFYFQIHHKI